MVESSVTGQNDEFDFLEEESDQCLQLYKKLDAIEAESPKNGASIATTASTKNISQTSLDFTDPYIVPFKQIMDQVYDVHLVKIPQTLKEALELSQQVKEKMYDDQIKRIVEVQKTLEMKKAAREEEL